MTIILMFVRVIFTFAEFFFNELELSLKKQLLKY